MAINLETAETAKAPTETDKAQAVSIEQLEATKSELAATKAALEEIKKAQAGADQKVAKLLAELDQKDKGKQTAEERIAAIEKKAADAEARAVRQEWLNSAYKLASDRGLKPKLVERFSGNLDELAAYLDEIKADTEAARKEEANKVLLSGNIKPGSGNANGTDPVKMTPEARRRYYEAEAEKRMPIQTA